MDEVKEKKTIRLDVTLLGNPTDYKIFLAEQGSDCVTSVVDFTRAGDGQWTLTPQVDPLVTGKFDVCYKLTDSAPGRKSNSPPVYIIGQPSPFILGL